MTAPGTLLGTLRTLTVLKRIPAGLLLDGEDLGEVLLPARELADAAADVEALEVFLYEDGDGRPRATLGRPKAMPGEVARLKIVPADPRPSTSGGIVNDCPGCACEERIRLGQRSRTGKRALQSAACTKTD